jgi:hypothetical protein
MNMNKLRRALERGNKVVIFDKVRYPLRPGSRILYESYAVFAKFEDLQKSWKCQQKLNLQGRSPAGVKAVIVPDLDQLPGEAAARHELAGLVELLAGYSIDEVCVLTGLDASLVHAVYAVYYAGRQGDGSTSFRLPRTLP